MEKTSRQAVIQSIRGLQICDYDWDGVGGLPLRGDVADTMTEIYEEGSELQEDMADNLPFPVVSLNSNGTIEVAYKDKETGRQLLMTFQSYGVVTYIKVFQDDQTTIEGTIRIDMLDDGAAGHCRDLMELFDWLAEE